MAELGILIGTILAAVVIALLDRRASAPTARVIRGSGHRSRIRDAIDRMRMRKPPADRSSGRAPDDP